jgi:hypothetical protein
MIKKTTVWVVVISAALILSACSTTKVQPNRANQLEVPVADAGDLASPAESQNGKEVAAINQEEIPAPDPIVTEVPPADLYVDNMPAPPALPDASLLPPPLPIHHITHSIHKSHKKHVAKRLTKKQKRLAALRKKRAKAKRLARRKHKHHVVASND